LHPGSRDCRSLTSTPVLYNLIFANSHYPTPYSNSFHPAMASFSAARSRLPAVALFGNRHDRGVDDLAAHRQVALPLQIAVEVLEQRLDRARLRQSFPIKPHRLGVGNPAYRCAMSKKPIWPIAASPILASRHPDSNRSSLGTEIFRGAHRVLRFFMKRQETARRVGSITERRVWLAAAQGTRLG